MLIFVVARSRLDRYEELRRQFENWREVSIILDRREGDRRTGHGTYVGVNRRARVDRRLVPTAGATEPALHGYSLTVACPGGLVF